MDDVVYRTDARGGQEIRIENAVLRVEAVAEGAELSSIWNKETGTEYLWQADPKWWKRRAPILFPFVGRCKDYQYKAKGSVYQMPQHGFARDMVFDVAEASERFITFRLRGDDRTRPVYPWEFCLLVTYSLKGRTLQTAYTVENHDAEDMYFSIGAHPGFKGIRSQSISLRDRASEHGVTVDLAGFPYLGLWAAPGAPYVCIEPWYGLADYDDFEGDISDKAGIQRLTPGDTFHCRFAVHIV